MLKLDALFNDIINLEESPKKIVVLEYKGNPKFLTKSDIYELLEYKSRTTLEQSHRKGYEFLAKGLPDKVVDSMLETVTKEKKKRSEFASLGKICGQILHSGVVSEADSFKLLEILEFFNNGEVDRVKRTTQVYHYLEDIRQLKIDERLKLAITNFLNKYEHLKAIPKVRRSYPR